MLGLLQIENYALIESLTLAFGPGFNVLTGETGSGKSIIVDALGLLLGERADTSAIRAGAAQAVVSGSFASPFATPAEAAAWAGDHGLAAPGPELTLRRELLAAGRSRAFLDGQLAPLGLVRELARGLGEIHSQHESLVSFSPAEQLRLLDRFAGLTPQRAAVASAHAAWAAAAAQVRDGDARDALRAEQAELWQFQAAEIDALQPQPGEDEALERERTVLVHAEKIAAAARAAYDLLYDASGAAAAQLKAAQRHLAEWARLDPALLPLARRLETLHAETADAAAEVRAAAARADSSPGRLAQIEDRLAALDRLRRKFGPAIADVLRHREQLAQKLEQAGNAAADRSAALARLDQAAAAYRRLAAALARQRRAAALALARKVEAEVADLAMTLRFDVQFDAPGDDPDPDAWGPAGWDRLRFIASTNPGEPMLPVAEIASGGELSRLLLALHVLAPGERGQHKTLVLDEVDAGIGGRAAEAVGRKLQQLGRQYQVLCVTHLPQIAAFAASHLRVEKSESGGRTRTDVRALDGDDRAAEIARMLAGSRLNDTALRHARELLAAHRGKRQAAQP